jgi:ABC-type amino acid transport substrate-binding protein
MRGIRKMRWAIAALSLVALLGVACGDDAAEEPGGGDGAEVEEFGADTTMGKIQKKGEIIIGVKYDVPPFGFENPQSGEIEGFDVDLGTAIADRLGVTPKFVEAISDNRIPFLQDGTVDLILSTMTITTDRDADIDFSNPYFIAHGRTAVYEGSDVTGPADLGADARICTALGSTYETTIIPKVAPDAKIEAVDAYSDCVELLQNGAVDAEITDNIILAGQKAQDDKIQLVGEDLTTDPYGIGIPDGQTDMQDFVNSVLEEMMGGDEWKAIYDKWVGSVTGEEPELPNAWGTLQEALDNYPCVERCDG